MLLKDRDDVVDGGSSGDNAGSWILNQLNFIDRFVSETKEEGFAVGGKWLVTMTKDSSAVGKGKGRWCYVGGSADCATLWMWDWKGRALSMMTPRLMTRGERETQQFPRVKRNKNIDFGEWVLEICSNEENLTFVIVKSGIWSELGFYFCFAVSKEGGRKVWSGFAEKVEWAIQWCWPTNPCWSIGCHPKT